MTRKSDPVKKKEPQIMRSLIRQFVFWLLDLKVCGGCTGLFQRLNAINGSSLCDRCFRELVEAGSK